MSEQGFSDGPAGLTNEEEMGSLQRNPPGKKLVIKLSKNRSGVQTIYSRGGANHDYVTYAIGSETTDAIAVSFSPT